MSKPTISTGSKKPSAKCNATTPQSMIKRLSKMQNESRPYSSSDEYGENQSDSSASNSSLASSSPRFHERHPRVLENARKKSSGALNSSSNEKTGSSSSRKGSFAMLSSRTSLPPLDENTPLNATESQLSLNLRRATRSTSWTNQKILDAIDGLNTCAHEIDPCLALGKTSLCVDKEEEPNRNESPRKYSFEKFVVPRSISNLIMKSRSSGSVNPGQPPGQNRDKDSCYNFLSGIREVDDEEQLQQDDATTGISISLMGSTNGKSNNNCGGSGSPGGGSLGIKLKISPASDSETEGVLPDEVTK